MNVFKKVLFSQNILRKLTKKILVLLALNFKLITGFQMVILATMIIV